MQSIHDYLDETIILICKDIQNLLDDTNAVVKKIDSLASLVEARAKIGF